MGNILVTGGANGIGRSVAALLSSEGHKVFIADIDEKEGKKTAKETGAVFIKTDVSDEESVKKCAAAVAKEGPLLALINNAAIADPYTHSLKDVTAAEFSRVISVNLTGVFLCSKYAHTAMQKGSGIINIASTRAFQSEKDTFAYSASKGAVVALTHSLAVSLGPDIRVNCISPGWINTDNTYVPTEKDNAQHPAGRVGTPDDIAHLISFLISDKASFITGQNFTADGGMTVKMIYDE